MHSMMITIENLIPRNQTTYMFLGEHVQTNAYNKLKNYYEDNKEYIKSNLDDSKQILDKLSNYPNTYNLAYFYPVLPFEYVSTDNVRTEYENKKNGSILSIQKNNVLRNVDVYHALFVMQGNIHISVYIIYSYLSIYIYIHIRIYTHVCV
jgi:hypothetical protein